MIEPDALIDQHYMFGKNYARAVRSQVVCHVWKNPVIYKDIYMRKRGKLVEIMLPELFDETTNENIAPATNIEVNINLSGKELKHWLGTKITEQYFTCLAYPGTDRTQRGVHSCNIQFMAGGKMLISPARGSFIKDQKFGCGTFSTVLSFINEYNMNEDYASEPPNKKPAISGDDD